MSEKKELNHKYLLPTFIFSIIGAFLGMYLLMPSDRGLLSLSGFIYFIILLIVNLISIKKIYGKLKIDFFSISLLATYLLITFGFLVNSKEHSGIVFVLIALLTLTNVALLTDVIKEHFVYRYLQMGIYYFITKIIGFFGYLYNMINSARESDKPERNADLSKHASAIGKTLLIFIFTGFPILLVVIGFLGSANPEFGNWMNQLFSFKLDDELLWARIFVFGALFLYFIGEFFFLKEFVSDQAEILKRDLKLGDEGNRTILRVMLLTGILLNIFYFIFVIAELRFDFGGAKSLVISEGVSRYSDLAVNRFWELIYVTIINLGFIYFLTKPLKNVQEIGSKILRPALQINVVLIAISTIFLIYSAINRMSIYESAYGFTNLRLVAHAFTLLLIPITLLVFGGIWIKDHSRLQLVSMSLVALFVGLYILLPIDYVTNKVNFELAKAGKIEKFDARYTYKIIPSDADLACDHYGDTASNDGLFVSKEILKDNSLNLPESELRCLKQAVQLQKEQKIEWYNFNLSDYLLQR